MSSVYVCMILWFVGWRRKIPHMTSDLFYFLLDLWVVPLLFVARLRPLPALRGVYYRCCSRFAHGKESVTHPSRTLPPCEIPAMRPNNARFNQVHVQVLISCPFCHHRFC